MFRVAVCGGEEVIIVRMQGGLGNQMFQYAAGAALAKHHACELRWDLTWYERSPADRCFGLHRAFSLDLPEATEKDTRRILGWRGRNSISALWSRRQLGWVRPDGYAVQPHFHYWTGFWALPAEVYLDGYWQTEKYFTAIESSIRSEFTFLGPLSECNSTMASAIKSCNAVSVHVRRGDYVTSQAASAFHGCCTPEYYREAIEAMLTCLDTPHFFIFSDDLEWAKSNLAFPANCTFVTHNRAEESYNDMRLMSMCMHHIIANSSFSWWGAWIGGNSKKLVVAPKHWFLNRSVDTSDLYCRDWILL